MKSSNYISILICFFVLTSCYENLDFKQFDDFVSKKKITLALNYFSLVPSQFFSSSGVPESQISDITNIEIFQNENLIIDIVKIDFNTAIKNGFDRDITITVEFLNNENAVIYTFTPTSIASKDLNYRYLEEIEIASNPDIVNTSKVKITVSLENSGTPLNLNDIAKFEFKSSMTVYVESSF